MDYMTVLVEKGSAPLAAIVEASMRLLLARRLRCERIRVVRLDGVRVADFPISAVEQFVKRQRLVLQPNEVMHEGPDWERHKPFWPGTTLSKGA